jgi:hypothetical protein
MTDVDEVPVIGEQYQGAGTVTDIDETVQVTPNSMTWNRKVVTTDSGAIFTLDHYVENAHNKEQEENKISVTKLPGRPSLFSHDEKETSHAAPPVIAAETSSNSSVDSSVPLTITVYSKNDPDWPPPPPPRSNKPEQVRGIWSFGDGDGDGDGTITTDGEEDDDAFWKPQQVLLYRPGLETIPEEESLPSGVWGYAEDQEPNSSFSSRGGEDPDDWHPKGLVSVVPPTSEVPANFVAAGRYTYKPGSLHTDWPPQMDNIKKQLHGVGKLKIPQCFDENNGGKLPITVLPKSKVSAMVESPTITTDTTTPKISKRAVTFAPPVGQWSYPEGQEENDDHFMPVGVDLYWGDDKPANSVSGTMSSDDGSLVSFGVWSSQGSVDLDDPEWEPEMSMVFPPGIEPDPEIAIQGRWAYRMNQNVKLGWPPPATQTAWVFPSKDTPAIEQGKSQGVWEFQQDRNDANEDDWEPLEVDILGEDDSLGRDEEDWDGATRPYGLWGIKHGAEPDRNWAWQPSDIVFFPPDVKPGDNTWVQGRWATKRSVGKLENTWPPDSASVNATRTMGKLKSVQWPKQAWVYPAQSVPPKKKETTIGVWRFTGGIEPKEVSSWKPQRVDLYGSSDKVDDTKPSGSWGVNVNARDTSDSHFDPEDMWFYPPGQSPEKECLGQGRWAFQKSKLDVAWPPPLISPSGPTRISSVGKLKIPGAFESEASPKVGRPRRSTGSDPKLPSLFSKNI